MKRATFYNAESLTGVIELLDKAGVRFKIYGRADYTICKYVVSLIFNDL